LVRALRRVPPDGYSKQGQPRWRLPAIINALAVKPQVRRETGKFRDRYGLRSATLDALRREYEEQVASIATEKSLDVRRAMAVAVAPLLQEFQKLYLNVGRSLRIADDDVLGARADLIWGEMLDEVSAAAEWSRDDGFFERMSEAMWPHADGDEPA